jgi:hypothetical protein
VVGGFSIADSVLVKLEPWKALASPTEVKGPAVSRLLVTFREDTAVTEAQDSIVKVWPDVRDELGCGISRMRCK